MRYAVLDDKRVITNIIEVSESAAKSFDAWYLGGYKFSIGDAYPQKELDARNDPDYVDARRAAKLSELSTACNTAITAGCDVMLSDGATEHFSLQETDQINLSTAVAACEQGATAYPYHADGRLCRLYPATDIVAIGTAATKHKLYHTTYCNHVMMWARLAETTDELQGIAYGAALPDDLAANMEAVLGNAGS